MSSVNNLEELLVEQLEDLYNAEQQLTKALPKMAKAASNSNSSRRSRITSPRRRNTSTAWNRSLNPSASGPRAKPARP